MLAIRLSRQGKRKYATFRIVITEKGKPPKDKGIEILGNYDPHRDIFNIDKERLTFWMTRGAKISPTLNNLLVEKKIISGKKVQVWKPKKKTEKEKPKEQKIEESKEQKIEKPKKEKKERS